MSELPCGCILMSEIISFKKKHYNSEEWLEGITQFNHKHHHLVDVNGDQKEKADIFNKGEDLKLQISKKQLNILTGEDTETKCLLDDSPESRVLRDCPYRALFKAAVGAMGRDRRQEFKNLWEDELVDEMVEEVERELEEYELESDDEEQTVEPEGCDSHTSSSEEEEEEPEKEEEASDFSELKNYLKSLTPEERQKYIGHERLRNLGNLLPAEYMMDGVYRALRELQNEEEEENT